MSRVTLNSTIVRSSNQVSTSLGEEVVLLGLQSEKYFGLKGVGTRIWEIIQKPKTVKEILDLLLEEYEVEPEHCEQDLLALLQQLAGEELIKVKDEATP